MITALTLLGGGGLLLAFIGRLLILREDRALSRGWRLALLAMPLAELVYLAGSWPRGKMGGSVALLGLVLLTPVVGEFASSHAESGAGLRAHVASRLTGNAAATAAAAPERQREYKQTKVNALTAYLDRWHESLQARRAALADAGPEGIASFDAEAAAYHALNTAAKDELRGLEELLAAKR